MIRGGIARIVPWAVTSMILVFLFAPVVLVVLFSFNAGTSTSPPLEGLSLRWYAQLLSDEEFLHAMYNSAIVAMATVVFVVIAGTASAFALSRRPGRLTSAASTLIIMPLIVPGLFLGVALLAFITRVGIEASLVTVFIGHALVTLPLVFLVLSARLAGLERASIEASRDLGASAPQAFMKVMLPALAPALVGAALLVAAWSLDEFIITLFTNGGDTTVPVLIYSRLRLGSDPSINAIASIVVAVTTAAAATAGRLIWGKDLRR
jgi:ABC-type spermidine/putrescine transport system permease subunit II